MRSSIFFSPYVAYCITFCIALVVYLLGWSYLYPPLSLPLLIFFIITFIISVLTAFFFKPYNIFQYRRQYKNFSNYIICFLVAGYLLDFLYSRSVPFLSIALGLTSYEDLRTDFGIPAFHVVLVSFNAFISIFYYHSYLTQKKKSYLVQFIISLILPLLIMSRITITFVAVSCFYIYIMSTKRRIFLRLIKITAFGLLFLFGFGLLGNIRTAGDATADDIFLTIGDAKDTFRESWVPKSFFWAYIYISSPVANLELTMDKKENYLLANGGATNFFVHEYLWDALSKRYDEKKNVQRLDFTQINDAFNVGTIYARPYMYLGTAGLYLMYAFIWIICGLFIVQLNKESRYYITYLASFNALIILCVFDNMLTFTPFSLIIIFPVIEKGINMITNSLGYEK